MREVDLPSGAKLKFHQAPYRDAYSLFQSFLEEMRSLKLDPKMDLGDPNLKKDVFCSLVISKKFEAKLSECMKRALYNELRITDDTWEPAEARGDYIPACFEVAMENIAPFMKGLYAKSNLLEEIAAKSQS